MHFLIGLIIVAAIIYFAFVRDSNDTDEQAIKKIARIIVVLVIIGGILLYLESAGVI